MDKKKQMIEYMVQDLVEIISETQSLEYEHAMSLLYNSEIYNKLLDIETGLYRESPAYVWTYNSSGNVIHLAENEINNKTQSPQEISQKEI